MDIPNNFRYLSVLFSRFKLRIQKLSKLLHLKRRKRIILFPLTLHVFDDSTYFYRSHLSQRGSKLRWKQNESQTLTVDLSSLHFCWPKKNHCIFYNEDSLQWEIWFVNLWSHDYNKQSKSAIGGRTEKKINDCCPVESNCTFSSWNNNFQQQTRTCRGRPILSLRLIWDPEDETLHSQKSASLSDFILCWYW